MSSLNDHYSIDTCPNCQSNKFEIGSWRNRYALAKCLDCNGYEVYYDDRQVINTVKIFVDDHTDVIISNNATQVIVFSSKSITDDGCVSYEYGDEVWVGDGPTFMNRERFHKLSIFK